MLTQYAPLSACLVVVMACSSGPSSSDEGAGGDSVAVLAAIDRYAQAGRTNDLAAMTGAWTDDAVYVNAGTPTIRGRTAVDSVIRNFHTTMSVTALDVDIDELSVSGDAAYAMGTFRETLRGANGDTLSMAGRFLHIWRRQPDGTWKLARAFGSDEGD